MHARTLAARGISGICVLALALVLASCQGRGAKTTTYTVGGTVLGLTGTGLVLQNNGGNNLPISASGAFTFSTALNSGASYRVTVLTQPSGQTCTVANGTGTVSANVTNVAVNCVSNTFTVGGTVSGLTGTGLVLQNKGGNDLAILANGPFTFSTALGSGVAYSVTVLTPPSGQGCAVTNGSGSIAGANVTNVTVACAAPPAAPTPSLGFGFGVKELQVTWPPVGGATFYRLLENPDGVTGYTQVATNIIASPYKHSIPVHRRLNASYILEACNPGGCTPSFSQAIDTTSLKQAIGYVKASNTGGDDQLGFSVALSGDGNTLAVGAPNEDSALIGVTAGIVDEATAGNVIPGAGAVYVFTRGPNGWIQQAYVKASNPGVNDAFGFSVALSRDGNTLSVGATKEDSAAPGIGGSQTDDCSVASPTNCAMDSGAVYVYSRNATTGVWTQQAYAKASNPGVNDAFGFSVALSGDGNTLAVGTPNESSFAGAVYVYTRNAVTWSQQAHVTASNTEAFDTFGNSVALSSDGNTLAVGAPLESSNRTGVTPGSVNEAFSGNAADSAGAAYVYTRSAGTWLQEAYVKASNTGVGDNFGNSVALSGDGNTLAVGAPFEDSGTAGVGSTPDESVSDAGAVYVFTRGAGGWSQQAYVKASDTLKPSTATKGDSFGTSVALSSDGNALAVGAPFEDGSNAGIADFGSAPDDLALEAGAVYFYTRAAGTWSPQAYVKASNTGVNGAFDHFGLSVALSGDGNMLAVGADLEDGGGTGVNNSTGIISTPDDSARNSGAVYLY